MERTRPRWTPVRQLAAFTALFVVALIPLGFADIPPLVDYPNHLARMYILLHAEESPVLQQFYASHWAVLPNLAMEGIVPLLAHVMPLEIAGKLFIVLTLFTLAGGTVALHYALFRRVSPWPLLVFLLLYNRIFLWGFLGYLFGIGLALWTFAAWVLLRERGVVLRTSLFALLSLLMFFAHLYAFGLFGLALVIYEAARFDFRAPPRIWIRRVDVWVPLGISLLLPVLVFLLLSPTMEGAAAINYGRVVRKLAALAGLFNAYDRTVDVATVAILGAVAALILFKGRLVFHKEMRPALIAMAVVFMAMPEMLFTSQAADIRFTVGAALFLIASTDMIAWERRWTPLFATLLVAVFAGRIAYISDHWSTSDKEYRKYRTAFSLMPEGSRLFTADVQTIEWKPFPTPTAHFPCIAIIERRAFVPTLFAHPTQQPVQFVGVYGQLAKLTRNSVVKVGDRLSWIEILSNYDYVLMIHEKGEMPVPEKGLVPAADNEHFTLYRVAERSAADETLRKTTK